MSFTCSVCGETHAGEMRDIRMGLPQPIFLLDDDEREQRAYVDGDFAALDGDRFFVRALLELPIDGEDGYFGYGTWVEVSREDAETLGALWHDDAGGDPGPFTGRLANELAPYAFTEGLPVRIRLRDVRLLPLVELDEANHELVRAQRRGISLHRAHELAATVA